MHGTELDQSPLPGFPLYEAAEMESIVPRFLVSCLLRCSGFSAAVRGRRERLRGGGKRECVRGEGRRQGGNRQTESIGKHPTRTTVGISSVYYSTTTCGEGSLMQDGWQHHRLLSLKRG